MSPAENNRRRRPADGVMSSLGCDQPADDQHDSACPTDDSIYADPTIE